jgi:pyrroline-5-carboxylate reductase
MPNTAALVGEGAVGISAGRHVLPGDVEFCVRLFEAVGTTVVVDEALLDAVTGLSGSGPAYVLLAIEALADGGVRAGLSRDVALRLAAQTVRGAATLVQRTGQHPALLRDMVTSPAGTTASGLQILEQRAVRSAFVDAVVAAAERSGQLRKG